LPQAEHALPENILTKMRISYSMFFLDEKSSQQPTNDGINGKKRPAMDPGS